MLVGKAGAYLIEAPFRKGLTETNTLAYYKNPYNTAVKSFIVQAPGALTSQA
jgi:hypothetical protein